MVCAFGGGRGLHCIVCFSSAHAVILVAWQCTVGDIWLLLIREPLLVVDCCLVGSIEELVVQAPHRVVGRKGGVGCVSDGHACCVLVG